MKYSDIKENDAIASKVVGSVPVYAKNVNLPVSGNADGQRVFVDSADRSYIWIGNGENDYGGWYKIPKGAGL
tara:strand:+ start:138 stop:353 length:216 start_codon:yes stop_codon:yes gene_type:complete